MDYNFTKYTEIENHYQSKFVNNILSRCPEAAEARYEITEKIDGSNFSLTFENGEVRYGKRTSYLAEDESFFDWQTVMSRLDIQTFVGMVGKLALPLIKEYL